MVLRKIIKTNPQNPPKTLPKPFQNLQKSNPNHQKSLPNATSNDDGAQEAPKSEKKRKIEPT